MKINFVKHPGGTLTPASEIEAGRMERFKTGDTYEVSIVLRRNAKFHGKMFAFFNFCFKYWSSDKEFANEAKQFEVFRNNLTVMAGFYEEFHTIAGDVRIEAKSLAYDKMEPEEFEQCYNAQINAAMRNLFRPEDTHIYNQLMSFF